MDSSNNNYDFSNVTHIFSYVIENHHKFILLLFVFVIIYFVDYIIHINTILYGATSVPGLPSTKTPTPHLPHIPNIPPIKNNKKRSKRRRR